MKKLLCIAGLLCWSFTAICQSFVGTLIDKQGSAPLENVQVSLPGVDHDLTNSTGGFSLNLSNCRNCGLGSRVKLNIYSPSLGFFQKEVVISKTSRYTISIDTDNVTIIYGNVRDKSSGDFLKGIEISCTVSTESIDAPELKTDRFGHFKFALSWRLARKGKLITLSLLDPSGNYESQTISKPIDRILHLDIEMKKKNRFQEASLSYNKADEAAKIKTTFTRLALLDYKAGKNLDASFYKKIYTKEAFYLAEDGIGTLMLLAEDVKKQVERETNQKLSLEEFLEELFFEVSSNYMVQDIEIFTDRNSLKSKVEVKEKFLISLRARHEKLCLFQMEVPTKDQYYYLEKKATDDAWRISADENKGEEVDPIIHFPCKN